MDPLDPGNWISTHNLQAGNYRDADNALLIARYAKAMMNWNFWIDSLGTTPPGSAPQVPTGYTLSDADAQGLVNEVPSGLPVCAPIAVHDIPGQATPGVHIGHAVPGSPSWFQALQGDTTAEGQVVSGTSSDGVTGKFQKFESLFGRGIYLKVG